jgi:hypothetical protein
MLLKKSAQDENGNNASSRVASDRAQAHQLSRARCPLSPSNGLIIKNNGRTGAAFRTSAASSSTSNLTGTSVTRAIAALRQR